jgi:hypothetical protein
VYERVHERCSRKPSDWSASMHCTLFSLLLVMSNDRNMCGTFCPARAEHRNRNIKHGLKGSQISTRHRSSTTRIYGPSLGRHYPAKLILFNFFNLVRYRLNVVVIFRLYVVKCYSHCLIFLI